MAVGHAPPRGWSARTHRLLCGRPIFPIAALVTLIYGSLQLPLFHYWLCTPRCAEHVFDLWRDPWVLGARAADLLLVADALLALWLAWGLVRWTRRPWVRDRVARVACLAGLGNLAMLAVLHVALAQDAEHAPSNPDQEYVCNVGGFRVSLTVREDLVPEDCVSRTRRSAEADDGAVRSQQRDFFGNSLEVEVPGPRLTIPLRRFDLVLEYSDVLKYGHILVGGRSFGTIAAGSAIRVTAFGVSVCPDAYYKNDWDYRGDLPD